MDNNTTIFDVLGMYSNYAQRDHNMVTNNPVSCLFLVKHFHTIEL